LASAQRAQDTAQHGLVDGATKPQLGASDLELDDAWTRASVDGRADGHRCLDSRRRGGLRDHAHRQQRRGGRCRRRHRPDVLTSPLEQKVGIDAALHRDPRDRRAGHQTLRDQLVLERPFMLPPTSRRPSCSILHGVHHLRWCTPSSGCALHRIRCCRAANPGAITVLVGLLRLKRQEQHKPTEHLQVLCRLRNWACHHPSGRDRCEHNGCWVVAEIRNPYLRAASSR
jgi:hypothetical protein